MLYRMRGVFGTLHLDHLRRQQGLVCEIAGWGPIRTPSTRALTARSFVLLSHVAKGPAAPPVLLVPAPIKRGYIYDLLPAASVVRCCIRAGLQPFLLEWQDPAEQNFGLADYADTCLFAFFQRIISRSPPKTSLFSHLL